MNRARLLLSCSPLLLLLLWNRIRASQSDIPTDQAMKELLLTASAGELQALLRSGDLTSVQLVKACLGQIAQYDRSGPNLRAIVSTPPEKDVTFYRSPSVWIWNGRRAKSRAHSTAFRSLSRCDTCASPTSISGMLTYVLPAGLHQH
jgi:Asp-tRNA(Asn)/Glu-tRNA(Gln) amidotransferase A subunit family amidase